MNDHHRSKAWIYYTAAIVSILGGILFGILKYFEIRKTRAEAAEAEARLLANKDQNLQKTLPASVTKSGTDGQQPRESKPTPVSTRLTLLPAKTEEEARKYWKFPRNQDDWQLVNGGLHLPGRVQRIATELSVEGDCRVEFSCGTAGWKGPAIRLFGETIGFPPAIGGWPIQYNGVVTRKGTSLVLEVEISQPGLKRLEDKRFEVTIKSANATDPSPITFVWPDDMNITLSTVKVTGKTTMPDE